MKPDCGLAGPGTVQVWKETGITESISRHLSSLPGLLDLCVAPLLECIRGLSGEDSPSSPVMRAGLKLLGGDFCMAYAGLYTVFESLERPALLLLPRSELPNIVCFGSLLSSMWVTCPTQRSQLLRIMALMLVDSAMPKTCRFETLSCHLMFRMVRRLGIWKRSSCFRCLLSILEAGENERLVHLELCGLPDTVLVQDASLRMAKSLAGLADPGADLLVETPVTADHTAKVFEVIDRLQLGAIN